MSERFMEGLCRRYDFSQATVKIELLASISIARNRASFRLGSPPGENSGRGGFHADAAYGRRGCLDAWGAGAPMRPSRRGLAERIGSDQGAPHPGGRRQRYGLSPKDVSLACSAEAEHGRAPAGDG